MEAETFIETFIRCALEVFRGAWDFISDRTLAQSWGGAVQLKS